MASKKHSPAIRDTLTAVRLLRRRYVILNKMEEVNEMTTLNKYIDDQKNKYPQEFEKFDEEYEDFKLQIVGELIRKKRKEKGLTQSQLAEMINTKKQAISRLERHPQDVK